MAVDAFMGLAGKGSPMIKKDDSGVDQGQDATFGTNYRKTAEQSDQYHYFLEFQHLKEYGREMWVKRRREDVIFSSRYARDQATFEKSCHKFILEAYQ